MTKKHFISLADTIRAEIARDNHSFSRQEIYRLADWCESQNPNFNRRRWLDYISGKCGPNGGKAK